MTAAAASSRLCDRRILQLTEGGEGHGMKKATYLSRSASYPPNKWILTILGATIWAFSPPPTGVFCAEFSKGYMKTVGGAASNTPMGDELGFVWMSEREHSTISLPDILPSCLR